MRGKPAKKIELRPDSHFNSVLVSKFINYMMLDGKKGVATKIAVDAISSLQIKSKGEGQKNFKPLEIFEQAITNVKPKLEIRSRRIGGANYQVPVPVTPERQTSLALRWLINAARDKRKGTDLSEALKVELELAFNEEGNAIKKKEDTQKMAEANRAFAQFG